MEKSVNNIKNLKTFKNTGFIESRKQEFTCVEYEDIQDNLQDIEELKLGNIVKNINKTFQDKSKTTIIAFDWDYCFSQYKYNC